MVRINENLILNEIYIIKAELSKSGVEQVLTLLLAETSSEGGGPYELVLRGSEAWALWEYLINNADRC
jgi:hypothetical protein